MVTYENLYLGSGSTTENPTYFTPENTYSTAAGNLGMALDARTANQLGDLNQKLNPGQKFVEIQGIQGRTMESIPDPHLDEMKRLSELNGVDMSLHGPLVNASGIEGQGGYTEEGRLGAENQIKSAVLRAHKLDPKGNINVTFHSSANLPSFQAHTKVMGKDKKTERVDEGMFIIDEDSGQIRQIKEEKRFFEEGTEFTGKPVEFDPKKELERINRETWTDSISQINRTADFGEDHFNRAKQYIPEELFNKIGKLDINSLNTDDEKQLLETAQRDVSTGQIYLRDSYKNMKNFFDKAWSAAQSNGNEEDKQKLEEFGKKYGASLNKGFETDPDRVLELRNVVDEGLKTLSNLNTTPKIFKQLNQFAIEKSAQTYANVAKEAYNKFGNTAPVISIENPPGGEALSTGEELRDLIKASRTQLAKNLVGDGMSKGKANKVAAQMIGATWDVGHINMMRKKGYSEQDVIEETKKIAPFVKHVHLSDNFGLDHTELPMGMGNVPLKPMVDEIKKQGFKGKEIIEAGNWWEFFSTQGGGNPFLPSLEGLNSPVYAMEGGPTWAGSQAYGGYFSGHGPVNTPIHHQIYQAGFQNMPVELGGEIAGGQGRFAGTPNQ